MGPSSSSGSSAGLRSGSSSVCAANLNRLWALGDKRVDPQETLTCWMGRAAVPVKPTWKKVLLEKCECLDLAHFLTVIVLFFGPSAFRVTLIGFVFEIFYRLTLIERRRLLLEAEFSGGKNCDDVEPRSHL